MLMLFLTSGAPRDAYVLSSSRNARLVFTCPPCGSEAKLNAEHAENGLAQIELGTTTADALVEVAEGLELHATEERGGVADAVSEAGFRVGADLATRAAGAAGGGGCTQGGRRLIEGEGAVYHGKSRAAGQL